MLVSYFLQIVEATLALDNNEPVENHPILSAVRKESLCRDPLATEIFVWRRAC